MGLHLLGGAASADTRAALLHTAPTQAAPGEALEVEGSLVGGSRLSKVEIRFRGPGGDYQSAPMELQYGDLYRGYIPAAQMTPPGVEYYVEGTLKTNGRRIALYMAAPAPARVFVLGVPSEPPGPQVGTGDDLGHADGGGSAELRTLASAGPPSPSRPELEDDLALFGALDEVALASRHDRRASRNPAMTFTWSREEIQALGARSVYDVLDATSGLTVSRDVQGFHRTAVRGVRSDPELLFLLNGHPLNNAYDGRALANLPVENVERIEVLRGPGALRYGQTGFLGVVNIVTVGEKDVLRASASAGSFDTFDGHLGIAHRIGNTRLTLDADVLNQTGYQKPVLEDAIQSVRRAQDLRGELEPAGHTQDARRLINVGAGASFESEAAGRVGASLRFLREDRTALIGLFDAVSDTSALGWQVVLADVSWRKMLTSRSRLSARAYFDQQSMERDFQLAPVGYSDGSAVFDRGLFERTDIGTYSFGLDAAMDIELLDTNRLSIGLSAGQDALIGYSYSLNRRLDGSYLGDHYERPSIGDAALPFPTELGDGAVASRFRLGAFAQDEWRVIDQVTLSFGIRLDVVQLPTVDAENQVTGRAWVPSLNPRVGVVWAPTESLLLKLGYARGFRSPTIQELAEVVPSTGFNQGRFEGNPALDPATVDAFEAGADWLQSVGEAHLRLRGNLFYESFGNPIAPVDDSGSVFPVRNRVGVRIFGAEGEVDLEVSPRARTWVNASWFRAHDLEAADSAELLTDLPQIRLNAGLSMPIGSFLNLDLIARVGAERRNNARSKLEYLRRYRLPSYTLITAQLRTELIARHLQLALVGHNLLDQAYADDVPRPDRMPGMVPREGLSGFLTLRAFY
ncbi:MAG: TonB-dependent receptor [Myxococcaceae bacterium]